ncbi:Rossmann-fold NAD(P)-binding domain-containing protein [Nocardiopsis baichengensis]|uniref:hypothetical protein n=1 Tax=Nocardiopsis baichengensis TaxID=280240 RepID=UPI00034BAD2C|nr:hypothetical protein [Nocardiopsis baichengensis]
MADPVAGVLSTPGERRAALVPAGVDALRGAGLRVLVERGAGAGARYTDRDYTGHGAATASRDEVLAADLVLCVTRPPAADLARLGPGQTLVGLLRPAEDPGPLRAAAEAGATLAALEGVPRTLGRAQAMDALSSQASVAGYKAVIEAARAYDGYLPLLMTAAGVARPARLLVLGAGVAGLQAIATAHRLGAVVTGYDVRPEAREEIASVGASVLEAEGLDRGMDAAGQGGYARALTGDERAAQRAALAGAASGFDIAVCAALVPAGPPPLLLTAEAVDRMRPGAVVVDLAAGPRGGNAEPSVPGRRVQTDGGVTVIGAGELAATVPRAASEAYSRNITALVAHLLDGGRVAVDLEEEIQAGVVAAHGGRALHPALAGAPEPPAQGAATAAGTGEDHGSP